jgi:hypothetical protein
MRRRHWSRRPLFVAVSERPVQVRMMRRFWVGVAETAVAYVIVVDRVAWGRYMSKKSDGSRLFTLSTSLVGIGEENSHS